MKQEKVDMLLKGVLEGVQDFYNVFNDKKITVDKLDNEAIYYEKRFNFNPILYFQNLLQMNLDPEYKKHIHVTGHINTLNDMVNKENERTYKEYEKEDKAQGKLNDDKRDIINDACGNIINIIRTLGLPAKKERVEHFSDSNNYALKEYAKKQIVKELRDIVSVLGKSNDNASFKVSPPIMYAIVKKLYKETKQFKKQGLDDKLKDGTYLEDKLHDLMKESRALGIFKPCKSYDSGVKLGSVADALLYGADGHVKDKSCVGRTVAVITILALLAGSSYLLQDKCSGKKYEKEITPAVQKKGKDIKLPEPIIPPKPEPDYGFLNVKEGDWAWKLINRELGVKDNDAVITIIEHLYHMNNDKYPGLELDTKVRVSGVTKSGKDGIISDELKPGMTLRYDKGFVSQFLSK